MRKQRNMVYADSPHDHYKDETVEKVSYDIDEDGFIRHLQLVAATGEVRVDKDRHLLMPLRPTYADVRDGRLVTIEGRLAALPPELIADGVIIGYKEPLTVIEQLATPWVSTYGHSPGESWGAWLDLCGPFAVRIDDRFLAFGRFLAWQAMEIRERVDVNLQPCIHGFLKWIGGPGADLEFQSADVRARWRTAGIPHVVVCASGSAHAALIDAVAATCHQRLIEEFARNKKPEGNHYCDDGRYLLAEALDRSGTLRGSYDDRAFAAAAYTLLGEKRWSDARMALAKKGCRMSDLKVPSDIAKGLDLSRGDLRLYEGALDRLRDA